MFITRRHFATDAAPWCRRSARAPVARFYVFGPPRRSRKRLRLRRAALCMFRPAWRAPGTGPEKKRVPAQLVH